MQARLKKETWEIGGKRGVGASGSHKAASSGEREAKMAHHQQQRHPSRSRALMAVQPARPAVESGSARGVVYNRYSKHKP